MKKWVLILLLFLFGQTTFSQGPIIPTPVSFELKGGKSMELLSALRIDSTQLTVHNWNYLKENIALLNGQYVEHSDNPLIVFNKNSSSDQEHNYSMDFSSEKGIIEYSSDASQFYAINSLLQSIHSGNGFWFITPFKLEDYPAFKWRGLHLDVSRHFYTVDEVKRFIDLMALYKFNTFHWHLTDDQGWRIEIKQYPKLTEVGAYRDSTMIGHYSDQPRQFDANRYGGFYTQDQIREIVDYANTRYINVVPEIELPGHSRAALAAYPELSCTGDLNGVPGTWGIFDDIYCSKQETIDFMKNVLSEVVELFPSKYIHIGGDEAPKTRWKECKDCQKVISENGLHDEHELQSYFIGQMDQFLTAKGKKLIGWDEILEGGLSPNAAVMSWRGIKGGIEAAKQKHEVVMTPTTYCYFDYYQSSHPSEPVAIGGFLPLEKVYKFNPIPKGISKEDEKYILGGQANLWTEYIASMEHLEYMTYPRALALAQSVWCREKPSFQSFLTSYLDYQEDFLVYRYKVNCARSIHQPKVEISRAEAGINVHFKGVEEDYLYNIKVTNHDKTATDPKEMGVSDTLFLKKADWNTAPEIVRTEILDDSAKDNFTTDFLIHSALGANIEMVTKSHPKFNNNGSLNLVDGIIGSLPWKGSQWLGFDTSYVEFIVDLGTKRKIKEVELGFLDQNGSWIYLPEALTVQVSNKSKRWKKKYEAKIDSSHQIISIGKKGRYVRVIVRAMDLIPIGQEGGGNTPWTFIDEIQVR